MANAPNPVCNGHCSLSNCQESNGISADPHLLLDSDLTLSWSKFQPSAISQDTASFNRKLQEIEGNGQKWYQVSRTPLGKLGLADFTSVICRSERPNTANFANKG
jgi:hypothetical protein